MRKRTYLLDRLVLSPRAEAEDRSEDGLAASLKTLADYIMDIHATQNPDGSFKVDIEAVAPEPGEDGPTAAVRLLKLAASRGAFDPAGRDQLRTANDLAEQAVITTSCLWHLLAELARLDPENTALDEDPIRFRDEVMEIAARRFDYIAEPGPEDGDTTDTFAGHVRDSRELSEVRRVLEAAIGRDSDPARSTIQVARDMIAIAESLGADVLSRRGETAGEQPAEPAQDAAADDLLFGDCAPPRPWWTYLRHARRSMLVARRLAVKRWQDREWEQHAAGHRRICSDCGAATTPRDPVFDTCRSCEREWMESK